MSDGTINIINRISSPSPPSSGRTKIWIKDSTKVPFYTDDLGNDHSFAPPIPPDTFNFPVETGETTSGSYEAKQYIAYEGSGSKTPTKIEAIVEISGATSGDIRIFDETNSLTVAELTGFSDASATLKDLGTISNLPVTPAIFSIQLLRTGAGGQSATVHTVKVSY